jgi:hypothetical protein
VINKIAITVFVVLIPFVASAAPKDKEAIELQVVSSKTKTHGSALDKIFAYTDVMFTLVSGKKVKYKCDQRGDICPPVESGKTYAADRDGDVIYISMSSPNGKKPFSVKYEQIGSW